MIKVISE